MGRAKAKRCGNGKKITFKELKKRQRMHLECDVCRALLMPTAGNEKKVTFGEMTGCSIDQVLFTVAFTHSQIKRFFAI
ncbi:hypothetical protein [Variovorax sp. 770b2]|uniref:hypothetical protein n=1 Tax=Variovorax sp. 770b2 TaxID=1566271 RepID=UPI001160258B|nr:hypothetical protein [Variovorax sp. 770b2]